LSYVLSSGLTVTAGLPDADIVKRIGDAVKRKKKALGGHISPDNLAIAAKNKENRPMILIGG
jgi:hypothetical protein